MVYLFAFRYWRGTEPCPGLSASKQLLFPRHCEMVRNFTIELTAANSSFLWKHTGSLIVRNCNHYIAARCYRFEIQVGNKFFKILLFHVYRNCMISHCRSISDCCGKSAQNSARTMLVIPLCYSAFYFRNAVNYFNFNYIKRYSAAYPITVSARIL